MKLSFKPRNGHPVWPACVLLAAAAVAQAQDPASAPPVPPASAAPGVVKPSKSSAQIDAGEPRANTSQDNTAPADTTRANTARANTAAEPPGGAAGAKAGAPSPPAAAGHTAGGAAQKGPAAVDRLDLGTATVTGDREQPKVMYIVPWKKSDIGDLSGKPMNSLLDEALAPVDRDEFKREVVYYGVMNSGGSGNGAPNKGAQGEK